MLCLTEAHIPDIVEYSKYKVANNPHERSGFPNNSRPNDESDKFGTCSNSELVLNAQPIKHYFFNTKNSIHGDLSEIYNCLLARGFHKFSH